MKYYFKNKYVGFLVFLTMFIAIIVSLARFLMPVESYANLLGVVYGADYSEGFLLQQDVIRLVIDGHILVSIIYVVLFFHQFSTKLRIKNKDMHKKVGYLFFCVAVLSGLSGLMIALLEPFGGKIESWMSILTFSWFMYCLYKSLQFAISRKPLLHREWMLRGAAVPIAAVLMRLPFSLTYLLFDGGKQIDFLLAAILTHVFVIVFMEISVIKNKTIIGLLNRNGTLLWKR